MHFPNSRKNAVVPCNFIRSIWPTHNSSIALLNNYAYKDKFSPKEGYAVRYLSDTSHKLPSLDPWFITGLVDAEGCFRTSIIKDTRTKTGWQVVCNFQIDLHIRDLTLLQQIQTYFGGYGGIYTKTGGVGYTYKISSLSHITEVIIPHFDLFPLKSEKLADFMLFKLIITKIQLKEHLTMEGVKDIVAIRASICTYWAIRWIKG